MKTQAIATIKADAIRLMKDYRSGGVCWSSFRSMLRKVRILSNATGMPFEDVVDELANYDSTAA